MIMSVEQQKATLLFFILHMQLYKQENYWGNESNTKH